MTDLIPRTNHLPDTIEDLAHFLLVAPEKAKAVKAEIQAIKNLGLAKEVYDQKLEEQHRLAELILDASVKIGEFTVVMGRWSGGCSRGTGYSSTEKILVVILLAQCIGVMNGSNGWFYSTMEP